jgi:hypothetical protein
MGNTGASFVIALLVKNASKNSGLPKTALLVDYEIVDGLQICHWPVSRETSHWVVRQAGISRPNKMPRRLTW